MATPLMLCLAVFAAPASATMAQSAGTVDADAQQYAQAHGVTVQDARERLSQQGELGVLKERVREAAGDRFAHAATEHEPIFGLSVTLTAGPEFPEIERMLAQSGHSYHITYVPVLTEAEGMALVESLAATSLRGVDGVDGIYYDGASGAVFVDYSGDSASPELLRAEEIASQRGATLQVIYGDAPGRDGAVFGP